MLVLSRREGRDDGMKVVVVVKQRAAAPLLPIRDIVAARATIVVLPRLLQQGNGSRAIAELMYRKNTGRIEDSNSGSGVTSSANQGDGLSQR